MSGQVESRVVALTFDDLPYARGPHSSDAVATRAVMEIVAVLRHNHVPAIGFVTGDRISAIPCGLELMTCWVDNGLLLGNHGATHAEINTLSPDQIRAEVEEGDQMIRSIPGFGRDGPLFYRFAQNHLGDTAFRQRAALGILAEQGYVLAAATIDTSDYVFNAVPIDSDDRLADKVVAAYLEFTRTLVRYYAAMNRQVWGRPIPEILLLHANSLNAKALQAIINLLRDEGFGFVSLAQAQADPVYNKPPAMVTAHGPMWGYRWARDKGIKVDGTREPEPPTWIMDYSRH